MLSSPSTQQLNAFGIKLKRGGKMTNTYDARVSGNWNTPEWADTHPCLKEIIYVIVTTKRKWRRMQEKYSDTLRGPA